MLPNRNRKSSLSEIGLPFSQTVILKRSDSFVYHKEFLGFWTLSIVLCLKEHDVSETGYVSVLR
jgi:hypothetical protein